MAPAKILVIGFVLASSALLGACGDDDNDDDNTVVVPPPDAGNQPGQVYDPCENKLCGDECRLCAPDDADCVETAVLKFCDSRGACDLRQPVCVAPVELPQL